MIRAAQRFVRSPKNRVWESASSGLSDSSSTESLTILKHTPLYENEQNERERNITMETTFWCSI